MDIPQLKKEIQKELTGNILDYWMKHATDKEGFAGEITNSNQVIQDADRGAVLNTRILWTFAAAYNNLEDSGYFKTAQKAYNYILKYFVDAHHGGIFWLLDHQGNPKDTKKQIYANAFAIYALAEYYPARKNIHPINHARDIFHLIERYSRDRQKGGYLEACQMDWTPIEDMRLSAKDKNEAKTFNTHLHILEAYTNLYRHWKDEELESALEDLIKLMTDKFYTSKSGHYHLFFDEDWNNKYSGISFGHDIEASWLMTEATHVLGNTDLDRESRKMAIEVADATLNEAIHNDGSILYEQHEDGTTDEEKHWWPQVEAMVGFMNAYQINGDHKYLDAVIKLWKFIQNHLIQPNGEWYWSVDANYMPNTSQSKVNMWKGPYHNSRGCIELMNRLNQLENQKE